MQPGPEGPPAVEAVEVTDGGEERLLRDVLGGRGVARDEIRGAVRSRPVLAEEPFEVVDGTALSTPDPGALAHPPTLRRKALTRSLRWRDRVRL